MAAPTRDRLLARYLEAATIIAEAPISSLTDDGSHGGDGAGEGWGTAADDGREGGGPEMAADAAAALDGQAMAALELLKRQAGLLARLHRSLFGGEEAPAAAVDDALLRQRLDDLTAMATSKLYAYRYDRVPRPWRCLYAHALVLSTHRHVVRALAADGRLGDDALDRIVEDLDRALMTTGGGGRALGAAWMEQTLQALEALWATQDDFDDDDFDNDDDDDDDDGTTGQTRPFADDEPYGRPPLSPDRACPRCAGWTLARFDAYMNGGDAPRPLVLTDLMDNWPALADGRWRQPGYLLSKTFGGRRLVPVEVGRSYVDAGWGQELMPFRRFLDRFLVGAGPVGYLAQHNLFRQVPSLRRDVAVPDFCWCPVPRHPTDASLDQPPVAAPQLNAWFGPAGTITPLHTDAYHNLLCQVVGTKYVRLYPPRATPDLRPRAAPEHGVDMSNTSQLDVGVLEGWDAPPPDGLPDAELRDARRRLRAVEYCECVMGPGDALLIPIGWWHYVRSLSVSFSVSFWWN